MGIHSFIAADSLMLHRLSSAVVCSPHWPVSFIFFCCFWFLSTWGRPYGGLLFLYGFTRLASFFDYEHLLHGLHGFPTYSSACLLWFQLVGFWLLPPVALIASLACLLLDSWGVRLFSLPSLVLHLCGFVFRMLCPVFCFVLGWEPCIIFGSFHNHCQFFRFLYFSVVCYFGL